MHYVVFYIKPRRGISSFSRFDTLELAEEYLADVGKVPEVWAAWIEVLSEEDYKGLLKEQGMM